MVPNIGELPNEIKNHIKNITMIEEMLISPILAVMSICRLPGGQLISKGYVANFAQDITPICQALPRLTNTLPVLIIKKTDQTNTNKEFKVNRKRITALLTFFCANNPDWKNKGIFQLIKGYHNKSITTNQLKVLKLMKKHYIHCQRIRFHQI